MIENTMPLRPTWTDRMEARPYMTLGLILLFALCLRIVFFTGLHNTDTLTYVETAQTIASPASFHVSKHVHRLRLGLILPTALTYWLWDVNEAASAIFPMLCSSGSIILIFFLAQLCFKNIRSGLVSALLLAIFPMEVFYASQVMPEIPLNFFTALCVLYFMKGEQCARYRDARRYYLFAGAALGLAYMIKIFAVFLALFFLAYLLYERRFPRGYLWIIIGFCGVWMLELIFYTVQTGNPFFRPGVILTTPGSGLNPNPGQMYRNDLFLYPYYWFISLHHFGLFYYAIITAFIYALLKRLRAAYIPMLWAVSIFLYLQFGREGKYLIHKEARFLAMITIPCILVLGHVLVKWCLPKHRRVFWLVLLCLGVTSIAVITFQYTLERSEFANLRAIARFLRALPDTPDIYIDYLSLRSVSYLLGYTSTPLPFQGYDEHTGKNIYPVNLEELNDGLVVINWHTINTLKYKGMDYIIFPEIIYAPPSHWELIQTIPAPDNWVYAFIRGGQRTGVIHYLPQNIAAKMQKTIDRLLKTQQENTEIYRIRSSPPSP